MPLKKKIMMTMSYAYKLISRSFPLCSNFMSAGTDESRCVYRTTKFNQTNGIWSNHLENCWPNYFDWKRQILDIFCRLNFLLTIRRFYISLTQSCAVDLNFRSNEKKFPKIGKYFSLSRQDHEFLPIDDIQTWIASQTL